MSEVVLREYRDETEGGNRVASAKSEQWGYRIRIRILQGIVQYQYQYQLRALRRSMSWYDLAEKIQGGHAALETDCRTILALIDKLTA